MLNYGYKSLRVNAKQEYLCHKLRYWRWRDSPAATV